MDQEPKIIFTNCGKAIADGNGGYICQQCFAVYGSAGMPRYCYDKMKEKDK